MSKKDVIDIIVLYANIGSEIRFYGEMKSSEEEKYGVRGITAHEARDIHGESVYVFPTGSGGTSDPTAKNAERMAMSGDGDYIREIETEIQRLKTVKSEIFNAFKILTCNQKKAIWYYYVDGKRWGWIGKNIGYDESTCRRKRDKGVERLLVEFEKNPIIYQYWEARKK